MKTEFSKLTLILPIAALLAPSLRAQEFLAEDLTKRAIEYRAVEAIIWGMPAVNFEGKILLEGPGAIALSPDGHGGSLRALERSGALDLMAREGIDTLSYFQVDNPLVRCIDPSFIGWHINKGSEMSSKMVPKAYPEEKLGHFCAQNGELVVIERSRRISQITLINPTASFTALNIGCPWPD